MGRSIFNPKILFTNYELAPLVIFISGVVGMATSYSIYSIYQKPDVRLIKSSEHPPWENVDPEKSQKLLTINKENLKKIPELEALRKEIGSYKT